MPSISNITLTKLVEQGYTYSEINGFLLLILQDQGIQVYDEENRIYVDLDPSQAWQFIQEWAKDNNFSISRRRSKKDQAEILFGDINNRQKLRDEAGSALNALKQKARETPPPPVRSAISDSLARAQEIQRNQIRDLEKRLFDPITQAYFNSPLLAHITNKDLRLRAATTLAGNPEIAAAFNPNKKTLGQTHTSQAVGRIHRMIQSTHPELAPLIYELHSDRFVEDAEKTLTNVRNELAKIYPDKSPDGIDNKALNRDMEQYRQIAHSVTTFTSLESILTALPSTYIDATANQKAELAKEIRKIVIGASDGPHLSGDELLRQLVADKKLSPDAALKLQFLAPDLEMLEISARSELTAARVSDRRRNREIWTQKLAETVGVNASVFWLEEKNLDEALDHYLKEAGIQITGTGGDISRLRSKEAGLLQAIDVEMSKESPDWSKYQEMTVLLDKTHQYSLFRQEQDTNPLVAAQYLWSKTQYAARVIKEPYELASRRIWSKITKVDEIIHMPFSKVADAWHEAQEGYLTLGKRRITLPTVIRFTRKNGTKVAIPLLDLPHYIAGQYIQLQKNVALRVFKWSYGLSQKGGIYSGFRHLANYSFGFIQNDADFRAANFFFGRRLVGNFLNWSAGKLGYASWTALKTASKEAVFRVGNKVTGGLLAKAAAYLTSLGLSVEGIGLITTVALVAWDVVKGVFGFIKKFIKNTDGFRDRILNWGPAIALTLGGLVAFVQGIPAAIAFGFMGLISFFGGLFTGLVALFSQAFLWAGAIVMGVFLLLQMAKVTSHIDAGVVLFNAVFCNQDSTTTANDGQGGNNNSSADGGKGSAIASCATCLVEYLQACYGADMVSSSDIQTTGIGCLIAKAVAPDVAEAISASATQFNWLQCVGFARAAVRCAGGDLGTDNGGRAAGYINNAPPGFKYVSGAQYCRTGDLGLVDGDIGHIFVVDSVSGPVTYGIDANYVCDGCVSAKSPIPTTDVAGCLKRN